MDLILLCSVFGFGFRYCSFEEGISTTSDGSENPQKGPLSTQVSMPSKRVGLGRVEILGNFRIFKVRTA